MEKISIVVIDDHKLIRQLWIQMFASHNEIEITGESGELDEGIEIIKTQRPDIVLLDINLVQGSGMDAVPLIRKFTPATQIIIVSMHNQPAYAKKMIRLGARAYITKNSSYVEIFKAIKAVRKGEIYICEEIKDILTKQAMKHFESGSDTKKLSVRELEIIRLMKEGLSSKEISAKLFIGTRTVEVHRHNILKKLNFKNTTSLINFINSTDLTFI